MPACSAQTVVVLKEMPIHTFGGNDLGLVNKQPVHLNGKRD